MTDEPSLLHGSIPFPPMEAELVRELPEADGWHGDDAGSYESSRCDWQAGDELRAAGNVRYRVTAVVPLERVAEFIDRPLAGILEVEPL